MIPLEQTGLASEEEWHRLKTLLVLCQHGDLDRAQDLMRDLPETLRQHPVARAVSRTLAGQSRTPLDEWAIFLTQRELPDAWTLLERL